MYCEACTTRAPHALTKFSIQVRVPVPFKKKKRGSTLRPCTKFSTVLKVHLYMQNGCVTTMHMYCTKYSLDTTMRPQISIAYLIYHLPEPVGCSGERPRSVR